MSEAVKPRGRRGDILCRKVLTDGGRQYRLTQGDGDAVLGVPATGEVLLGVYATRAEAVRRGRALAKGIGRALVVDGRALR